jgi:hypothetical protein
MTLLIKEFGDIRQFLETHVVMTAKKEVPACPEPEEIVLDFESWLNTKKG